MPTTDHIADTVERVRDSRRTVVGHNLYGFDLLALERHHGLAIEETLGRVRDTMLQAWLADPPTSWETEKGPGYKSYSLDAVAQRVLGREKDTRGKELVKEFGGWDHIPIDDPRYHAYCEDDAALALRIHQALPWTPYMEREMRVQAVMARMTLNGFRVDVPELDRRIAASEERKQGAMKILQEEHGIPVGSKSPLATKAGKEALIGAFRAAGAPFYPKTPTGEIQTGREGMAAMLKHYGHLPAVARICELVTTVTTTRTIYGTIKSHLHGERVHPQIWPSQASGRWSVTNPGLTVVGKRGALAVERQVFIPEEGHSIIAVDLSQVDMRAVAAHSQDHAYMDLFAPGRDVHTEIAVQIFGDPGKRQNSKELGHGANYGLGRNKMIAMGHDPDVVDAFFAGRSAAFPRLMEWTQEVREQGESEGVLDNGFGRPLKVQLDRAYTQAPAQMGQGTTRDLMAQGLLDLAFAHPEILPYLRGIIHDEVVLSVPAKDATEIGRLVVKCFEREWAPPGASRTIPILADLSGPGTNWGNAYEKG
jgi:DNA polymerase I-like protein with 3'-5' exonuclease and polymerase domains